LALARPTGEGALVAGLAFNGARLAQRGGETARATALLREAELATQSLPPGHERLFHLLTLGRLRLELGGAAGQGRRQAAQAFAAALDLARTLDDRRGLSYSLGYQAQLHADAGQAAEALALYRRAAFAAQQLQAPDLLYRWQWASGRLLRAQGDQDGAILAYQQAVANLQAIRTDITAGLAGSGDSFRTRVGDAFLELTDLLLQRAARQSAAAAREPDLRAARDTMEALKTAEVRDYFQDACAAVLQARTLGLDQPLPGTAVLYPILLPDRLELLLNSAAGLQQIRVAVRRDQLTEAAHALRGFLEKRTSREYLPLAQRLYDWLIDRKSVV
jgi:tetratricopeptide (TPR) repeat protein